jgi:hypothetical protein
MAAGGWMRITAVAIALAFPAAAAANATLVSPTPGQVTGPHPLFTWALPAGEYIDIVDVAFSPETRPDGRLNNKNVRVEGSFSHLYNPLDTSWTPPTRWLFAGPWWWQVVTRNANFHYFVTPPQPFQVAETPSIISLQTKRDLRAHWLDLNLKWAANVRNPVVVEQVLRGKRVLWTHNDPATVVWAGTPAVTYAQWHRPARLKKGTRLTLVVTLKAGAATQTVTRAFRAP